MAVFAENMYEDLELWYPLIRMREEGAEVAAVGSGSAETFRSKHGLEVKAELSAEDAGPEEFDTSIIPGGFAPTT